jgi:hypothetical protein
MVRENERMLGGEGTHQAIDSDINAVRMLILDETVGSAAFETEWVWLAAGQVSSDAGYTNHQWV